MARIDELEALKGALQYRLDAAEPKEFAGLSREYRAILAEIDELRPPEKKGDVIDQIAEKRNARRGSTSPGEGRSKRSG